MKKIVLRTIPILMVLTMLALTLFFTGIIGEKSESSWFQYFIWILVVAYAFSMLVSIGALIYEKGNPSKSLAWIIIILLLPGLGVILYGFFGAHFGEEGKTKNDNDEFVQLVKRYREKFIVPSGLDEDELAQSVAKESDHPAIRRIANMMSTNPKAIFSENNRMEMLVDGKNTFDAIFEVLKNAKHHIHMEYFIWTHDELGQKLKDVLIQKVKDGVKVRIIIDGLGSLHLKNSYIRALRDEGIDVAAFRPVRWAFFNSRFNFRNHRKIIVVDGDIGFTGGINVDGKYLKGDPKLGHWRDTHLKIEGDAVKGLQLTFLVDWHFLMEENIEGEKYFPKINFTNQRLMHIIASDSNAEWDGIKNAYITTINSAKKYVWLATPYLVPGESTMSALKCAATAGLDVRLIVPDRGDSAIVQLASQSFTEELLSYGVKVYKYKNGFIHAKVMVSDDCIGTIGTSNLDIRSFDQNLEVNAFFYDKSLVQDVKDQFEKDFQNSKELKFETLKNRSLWIHFKEGAARLLAPLL